MKTVSPRRRRENAEYSRRKVIYLLTHPLCQITLAKYRVSEEDALLALQEQRPFNGSLYYVVVCGLIIPFATQIHHRNKRDGSRLNREEWWMSAAKEPHDLVEKSKNVARRLGLLCEINTTPDGRLPDGRRYKNTEQLIRDRARGVDNPFIL